MRRRLAVIALLPLLALTALIAPHALAQGTLDQSDTAAANLPGVLVQGDPTTILGQTFTAGLSGSLDSATFNLVSVSAGTTITVGLYATTGGLPVGTALATGTVTVQTTVPPTSAAQYTPVTFSPAATVVAGQVYALVLGPVQTPVGGFVFWSGQMPGAYAGGTTVTSNTGVGGPYNAVSIVDLNFQTFVSPPTAAPAPVIVIVNPPVTLGIAIKGCGSLTPSAATTVNLLQAIPVLAVPCSGSVFVGWTGGPCSGTRINPCDIAPSGTTTILASFAP